MELSVEDQYLFKDRKTMYTNLLKVSFYFFINYCRLALYYRIFILSVLLTFPIFLPVENLVIKLDLLIISLAPHRFGIPNHFVKWKPHKESTRFKESNIQSWLGYLHEFKDDWKCYLP